MPFTIDEQMHKDSKYCLPYLNKKIDEAKQKAAGYIELEDDWNGYEASGISVATIKHTLKTLNFLQEWFSERIGFLNNRRFEVTTWPSNDGTIHIELDYAETYSCDLYVSADSIDCHFTLQHRVEPTGSHVIADRDDAMWFAKDRMHKKCTLKNLGKFLHEAFYAHKWQPTRTTSTSI